MTLSTATVEDLVATLRHLKKEYDRNLRVDAIIMDHVDKALARVEIEQMMAREALKIAAE